MVKLKTGVSTSLDFVKAMKERGQNVSPIFPAETLREQLDALSDEVKVTFNSDNETILQVVNDYEPEPPIETVTLTLDYNGGETASGEGSKDIELEKGASYTPTDPTSELAVIPEERVYDGWSPVKDNSSLKIEGSITVDEDKTIYTLWEPARPAFIDWDGTYSVDKIYFKNAKNFNTSDPNWVSLIASIQNYGGGEAIVFPITNERGLNVEITLADNVITIDLEDAERSVHEATWIGDTNGIFTLSQGSNSSYTASSECVITYDENVGGSIEGLGPIVLQLIEVES